MTVIWGLDLKEIQWNKFSNSNMWNDRYHLRRTKFIVYQLAMIFCVVSESLGTAALSDYVDQQNYLESHNPSAHEHNNSFIGAFSYNIFVGVYVATIFGAAFFFDLFWPERSESRAVKLSWRICSMLAPVFVLSAALLLSVILTRHHAAVTGVDRDETERLLGEYGGSSPLEYRQNRRALASVILVWLGFPSTVASTIILWVSYDYNEMHGTQLASRLRQEREPKPTDDPEVSHGAAAQREGNQM